MSLLPLRLHTAIDDWRQHTMIWATRWYPSHSALVGEDALTVVIETLGSPPPTQAAQLPLVTRRLRWVRWRWWRAQYDPFLTLLGWSVGCGWCLTSPALRSSWTGVGVASTLSAWLMWRLPSSTKETERRREARQFAHALAMWRGVAQVCREALTRHVRAQPHSARH